LIRFGQNHLQKHSTLAVGAGDQLTLFIAVAGCCSHNP